jgi:hypothetical protein
MAIPKSVRKHVELVEQARITELQKGGPAPLDFAALLSSLQGYQGLNQLFQRNIESGGGGCAYAVSAYLLRRDNPRLKWGAVALMGITAMQWTEAVLWINGPIPHGMLNQLVTIGLIPLALLAQAWGPLLGSTFDRPVRKRRVPFYFLLILGLAIVVVARTVYQPTHTQITPTGHLNWYSAQNPPVFVAWAYGLWAVVIGAPFLLWW